LKKLLRLKLSTSFVIAVVILFASAALQILHRFKYQQIIIKTSGVRLFTKKFVGIIINIGLVRLKVQRKGIEETFHTKLFFSF
jgi:hypothetical protein